MSATRGRKFPVVLWGSILSSGYSESEGVLSTPTCSSRQPPLRQLPIRVYYILNSLISYSINPYLLYDFINNYSYSTIYSCSENCFI